MRKFTRGSGVCVSNLIMTFNPSKQRFYLISILSPDTEDSHVSSTETSTVLLNINECNKFKLHRWSQNVTICLFLIIYPVIITILAKIKHTHIAHYLGNTAHQKLISCWGRLPNPDWPSDIPITMGQCLREGLLSYLSWNTHHWFMSWRLLCL